MKIFLYALLFINSIVSFASVELGTKLKNELTTPKVRIVLGLDSEARHKYLDNLKSELSSLQTEWGTFVENTNQKSAEIKNEIERLSNSSQKSSSNLVRRISILHKLDAVVIQIKETKLKILEILQQHIEFLSKNIFETSHVLSQIEEKSLYGFSDLQIVTKKFFVYEDQVRQILIKKEELFKDISRQEHLIATKEKDFSTIEQVIEDRKRQSEINKDDISLLDTERDFIIKEREYASLKLNLFQKQLDFLNSKESIFQERVTDISEQLKVVRSRLFIDENELDGYEHKVTESKKIMDSKISELQNIKNEIILKKVETQDELDRLRNRFKITVNNMRKFIELNQDISTISERFALYSVANAFVSLSTFDRMIHKIKLQVNVLEDQYVQSQVALKEVKLLYGIIHGQTKDSQTFQKERIEYKQAYQTTLESIKKNKEMEVSVHAHLKEYQKYIEYLKQQHETMNSSVLSLSTSQQKKLTDSSTMLLNIIQELEKQYELLFQMSEFYEQIMQSQEETLESIKTILHEFDTIGVWHRSISAVTWDGVKNIIPDIKLFFKNLYIILSTYATQFNIQKLAYIIAGFGFGGMLITFLMLFLIFFLYLSLQAVFPMVYNHLISDDYDDTDPLYIWRHIFAILIGFGGELFKPLYFWFLCLLYEFLYKPSVPFLILFYIYSIIFWIYASRKLLQIILMINRKFDYFLLSKRLIDRFSFVFSFFSISTIIILVMRRMFIVVLAQEPTELPNILLRVYHIVIFISIIFSLDKDEIVQALPKKSTLAKRFTDMLERYYYLFLLGIFSLLIMSDPYLGGYGSLMWHIFWNLFVTIATCGSLFLLYTIVKQYSAVMFFDEQEGTVTGFIERFEHAKTWYAIYIISSVLLSMFIGIVVCSHVWGYGITLMTLKRFALFELFKLESLNAAGKIIPESFKVYNLLYIIFMFVLGVVIAYIFKRFVLKRLFDIQYVDIGIQNTVIIISRYVIIISIVMMACIQSKLGSLVTYISYAALVVFGWSFKDLFTDFVAYFFILVQRPVKLGDYIKIDNEAMGVVRRVGPRAVILRRKNSVNIVVPNSTILKSALYNWNYTRSYIGIDDILFCVPFGTDIHLVKKICFEVLEEDADVLKVPQPFVRLQDFDDKGYIFMLRGFVASGNTLRQWDIASNLRFNLVDKLSKAGIQIAGPTIKILVKNSGMDIHKMDQ
ncbi:mechanosensitive ion channel [Candidatus Dependentiae bacterium]|nr:mechanosensitive ion channel [Candidatus Dependentiae bacterium]